ncbi:MFS transporter [Massilia sp. PAMC28688]|uniref:MFS transporter n=1 Tax=Massilia sp. PAMC28688 TaxID=2861283 RepID=UPI001C62A83B|nr:MFS transporter [Massilia sp. PAMC28688]QYF95288.1 MFS transporter [Massilia sp. PAMC28688]
MQKEQTQSPWSWIPSLYFLQALPYVVVMTLSTIIYKARGIGNDEMAFYTSMLYLPWVIKPLWSPLVELFSTKRTWTVVLQLIIGISLVVTGFAMQLPNFFIISIAVLWVMAFASATHDIAADGFYMLGLKEHQQAAFVGVRSTFYRIATIAGGGVLAWLGGELTKRTGDAGFAWSVVFFVLAGIFIALFAYHAYRLPRPADDKAVVVTDNTAKEFVATFVSFFKKPEIWLILGFILTYRLGESQLLKMAIPFMMDPAAKGGLGLTTEQVGLAYGTIGIIALTIGGLLGGYFISRVGLKRALWPMVFAVHTPDLIFVYMSSTLPDSFVLITACLAIEQMGYGFGFTALMMFMIMVSQGEHKTAHYSICTGLMALGMMVPGMYSGRVQEFLGYQNFFIYVCLMTLPAFLMAALVRIDPEFGKKTPE